MSTTKLTLSVDKGLIARAKKLANQQGTSLSAMIARLLNATLEAHKNTIRPGPLTRKATGLIRLPAGKSDRELIEDALAEKYDLGP